MTDDDVESLHHLTNQKIEELNEYLIEADERPVNRLNDGWDYKSISDCGEASLLIEKRREEIDTLDLPMYVDARASTVIHNILGLLDRLETARQERVRELTA